MSILETTEISPADLRNQWKSQSYVLVRGLFSPDEAPSLLEACEHIRREWSKMDVTTGTVNDNDCAVSMRHLNHPAYTVGRRELLLRILEVCADSRVLELARAVLADEPSFFTTTFWFNPRGMHKNGNWHRDTQFVTKTEQEEKAMLFGPTEIGGLQLQIALAASDDTEVVPGSHLRWDTPGEYHIRKGDNKKNAESDDMPGALRVALEPGDAVAFNACALHRGRYHSDKQRRTIMLTYSRTSLPAEDNYFTRQPWVLEPGYLDGTSPRARDLFEKFIRKYSDLWKEPPKWK